MRFLSLPLCLAASLSLAAPPPSLHAQAAPLPSDTTVYLQPGDVVKVSVWKNAEMSGDFIVGVNGALLHPLYQDVHITNMPLDSATAKLRQFLTKYQVDPQIVIEPMFHVTVGGEVRSPNLLSVPRATTIAEAVAMAGGPTQDGRLDKVKLLRGGHEYQFDLTSATAKWAQTPVRSEDLIIVGKRGHFFSQVLLPILGLAGSAASIINLTRNR